MMNVGCGDHPLGKYASQPLKAGFASYAEGLAKPALGLQPERRAVYS